MLSRSLPDNSEATSLHSDCLGVRLILSNPFSDELNSDLVGVKENADDLMLLGDRDVREASGCPPGNMPGKLLPIGW